MWFEGDYTDWQRKMITQNFFDDIARNKDAIFQLRDILFRAVDIYLKMPTVETLKMVADLFEQHSDHAIMKLVSEIWRLKHLVKILQTEQEYGMLLFSFGIHTHEALLQHLNQCIFAIRRIEMGEEDELIFVQEGIDWLLSYQISPIAISIICAEEVFVNVEKIYRRMLDEYETKHMDIYAQIMKAILMNMQK